MLNWTYEVEPGNIAYKGIAVRLDEGPGGISKGHAWMLYDHDTMRVAAAWTGEANSSIGRASRLMVRTRRMRVLSETGSSSTHPVRAGRTRSAGTSATREYAGATTFRTARCLGNGPGSWARI